MPKRRNQCEMTTRTAYAPVMAPYPGYAARWLGIAYTSMFSPSSSRPSCGSGIMTTKGISRWNNRGTQASDASPQAHPRKTRFGLLYLYLGTSRKYWIRRKSVAKVLTGGVAGASHASSSVSAVDIVEGTAESTSGFSRLRSGRHVVEQHRRNTDYRQDDEATIRKNHLTISRPLCVQELPMRVPSDRNAQ